MSGAFEAKNAAQAAAGDTHTHSQSLAWSADMMGWQVTRLSEVTILQNSNFKVFLNTLEIN